ncbi:unnamed protein product [Orchesella dallaii]|uniref:Uncharacterized protein n=1 Tax=Orchesella dallaii TaxID=48710 RepID=A0ABP1QCX7_9HEXA
MELARVRVTYSLFQNIVDGNNNSSTKCCGVDSLEADYLPPTTTCCSNYRCPITETGVENFNPNNLHRENVWPDTNNRFRHRSSECFKLDIPYFNCFTSETRPVGTDEAIMITRGEFSETNYCVKNDHPCDDGRNGDVRMENERLIVNQIDSFAICNNNIFILPFYQPSTKICGAL